MNLLDVSYQSTVCIPPNSKCYHAVAVSHYYNWPNVLDGQHGQVVHHLQAALHPPGVFVALGMLVSWWNLILDQKNIRKRHYAA